MTELVDSISITVMLAAAGTYTLHVWWRHHIRGSFWLMLAFWFMVVRRITNLVANEWGYVPAWLDVADRHAGPFVIGGLVLVGSLRIGSALEARRRDLAILQERARRLPKVRDAQ